jgi:hypothetical protein
VCWPGVCVHTRRTHPLTCGDRWPRWNANPQVAPHRRRPRCLQSFLLPTWLAPEPHGNDEGERRPGSDRGPPLVGVLRESREVDGVLPTRWLQPRPGRTPPACVGAGRVADEERQVAAFDLAHPPPGIDAEYQLVQPPPGASPRSTPMSNAIPAARSIPASRALSSVTYSARLAPAVAPNGPAPLHAGRPAAIRRSAGESRRPFSPPAKPPPSKTSRALWGRR